MSPPTCPRCRAPLPEATPAVQTCSRCGQPLAGTLTAATDDEDRDATRLYDPSAAGADAVPDQVGPYRLLRRLGSGGMGSVYEAEAAGRRVAVKLIAPGRALSAEAVERFRREGRLAGSITDPRCVFVLAADTDAGRPYLVMELMPGRTLTDLVEEQGPLPVAEAIAKVLDVIAGLQAAHRLGVIHRDIKPGNCFLCPDSRVKVGDFGLAKTLVDSADPDGCDAGPTPADPELTQQGAFLGTVLFAAPEQLRREPLDFRSDVYSVSATLYYLLSGQAPYEGRNPVAVAARMEAGPPPALRGLRRDVPARLDRVVRRGLEHDPERRWPDLEALRRALLRFGPGRLAVGGLGLRLLAFAVDFLALVALSFLFYTALSVWWPNLRYDPEKRTGGFGAVSSPRPEAPASYLVVLVPEVLYFTILEGVWGCALGKWLFRLRVARPGSPRPPGLARALVRTSAFLALLYLPLYVVHVLPLDCMTKLILSLLASSKLGSLLLVMSTMRERNGFRGLHEFASGTCVLQLSWPGRDREVPFGARGRKDQLAEGLAWPAELPAQVGPFRVEGTLGWHAAGGTLVAEDVVLGRKVLLWLRPRAEPPLSPRRREVNRPTRPRWLAGGVEGDWQWDAFAVQPGCSLDRLLAAGGRRPGWDQARGVLGQLADELADAGADGTVPEALTIGQVWVERGGPVQLLDMPLGPPAPGEDGALPLLGQVARLLARPDGRPAGPLPLHATAMRDRLLGGGRPYTRVEEFQADLAATQDRPTRLGRLRRGLHLLVQASLFVVAFVFSYLLLWQLVGNRADLGGTLQPLALLGIVWASAARGGPSFAVCGIALVRRDGRRAGWWRSGWRALLAWAQGYVLIVVFVTCWNVFVRPRLQTQNDQQMLSFYTFVGVLVVYTFLAVWLPRRSLHDVLAGTYLVPE
jgi:uncharacterized RDD family membrane protein YckC